ncbi:hypothetical protein ACOJVU_01100 [Mycobacterium sp. THU-M104]|uniref:hypothetical protein n=1 Tax=Mycobacterium sp. THU-M104 TaxID=3410515 RepID=UPI003B9B469B
MTYHYLDSSVAVRIMLGHSASAAQWFDSTTGRDDDRVVSSRILRTEIIRVVRRENLPVADRDQILDYIDTIPLTLPCSRTRSALDPPEIRGQMTRKGVGSRLATEVKWLCCTMEFACHAM